MTGPVLRRLYCFSDTYGRSKNPFTQDDADALISTDFRSFPLEITKREFDIYGRETITGHILRVIFELHDQLEKSPYIPDAVKKEFAQTTTGIFINAAPRVGKNNGDPFYVATAKNIRIVTTDPAGLSCLKDKIESIAHLPNDENGVYKPTEQFRSSYTAFLLHPEHNLKLVEDSLDVIPDYPEDSWELSYVDRFGNIITYTKNPAERWKEIEASAAKRNGLAKLLIGNVSQHVAVGKSLKDADPGSLVVYQNGDIEILRKWEAEEDSYTRLYKSAFFQFNKPVLGSRIRVLP
jgi:hypothetical protein